MDILKPRKKNKSRFQVEPEEPYGQLVPFHRQNRQPLPPLKKLGGAKNQRALAEAAALNLNQTQRPNTSNANENGESFFSFVQRHLEHQNRCSTAMQRPESVNQAPFGKRPSTEDTDTHVYDFGDHFKLPPINEASNRGPLPKPESKGTKKSRLSARRKMKDENRDRDKVRGGGDGIEIQPKRPASAFEKESSLARRFAQIQTENLGIRPGDDATTRLGKMRSTLQMFDLSAPAYQRSTEYDYGGLSNANRPQKPSSSEMYHNNYRDRETPTQNYYHHGPGMTSNQTQLPSLNMTSRRMCDETLTMGDRIQIQIKGQKKRSVGRSEFRGTKKFSKLLYSNVDDDDVEMLDPITDNELD